MLGSGSRGRLFFMAVARQEAAQKLGVSRSDSTRLITLFRESSSAHLCGIFVVVRLAETIEVVVCWLEISTGRTNRYKGCNH